MTRLLCWLRGGHAPGSGSNSLALHEEILALIEKERLAGRTLTFLEAARRIEREQAKH